MKYKLIGLLLWVAVGIALWLMFQNRQRTPEKNDKAPKAEQVRNDPVTVTVPAPRMTLADFSLVNTRGEKVTLQDLLGRPAVYSFVFSRCIETCRPITLEMKKLHDKLADEDVQFVSITVDPDFDTVEKFGAFADIYDPDYERWQFLTGPKQAIYDMIRNGFHLTVVEMFGADAKPGMEVTHTNRVVLVNPEGIPVKTYVILNDADRAKLTRVLQGKDEFPQPPEPGRVLLNRPGGETEDLSGKDE